MKNASITYVYVISFLMRWPHGEKSQVMICRVKIHCFCVSSAAVVAVRFILEISWHLRSNEKYSVPQPHEAGGSQEKHTER